MPTGILQQAGARATSQQVKALEHVHKKMFADLVTAWDKYHIARRSMYLPNGTYNLNSPYTPTSLNAYAQRLIPISAKWNARQRKYEKIPNSNTQLTTVPLSTQSFVIPSNFEYLKSVRDKIDKQKQVAGIGFIPLIIWAIIAIVAAFSAVEITDELNVTAEEQAKLVTETDNFCTSQNLTPEQCQALLQQQTNAVTEGRGSGSIVKYVVGAGLIFAAIKYGIPEAKKRYGKKETAN